MDDRIFKLRLEYRRLFKQEIPNEPAWPSAVMDDPARFADLLERSVQEKKDLLTAAYGAGWNEQDPENLY